MSDSFEPQHPSADEILWDVEAEHLDEAEFLWEVWEAALVAPDYTLAEVAEGPEQRLLAHVDALTIGGPVVAERLLLPAIENPDAYCERVAAATLAAWGVLSVAEQDRVLAALRAGEDDQCKGIVRALELLEDPGLDARLIQAIGDVRGAGTAAVLELLARRRVRVGDWVLHFLRSDDPRVATAAARLVKYCPEARVLADLGALARAQDAGLRQAALETALYRQVPGAWESAVYWAFVDGESPFRRDALTWVASFGDASVHQRLLGLVDAGEHRADVLWALGFCGRIAAVDRCVELLGDAEFGRLAGEVVCAIAGLSTEDERFWIEPSGGDDEEDGLPELGADDLSADLVPEAEDALPLPEPGEIARWWAECRGGFDAGGRYLGGEWMTGEVVVKALAQGAMRRRRVLGFELEVRSGGGVVVDALGFSAGQRARLTSVAGLEGVNPQRAFSS